MEYDYIGLTGLEIGGFQIFDALTYIPIRRITFLFGPNSAGKSAVEDALLLCQEMLSHSSFDSSPYGDSFGERFERLKRHWRRTSESPTTYAENLHLHLRGNIGTRIQSSLASYLGRKVVDACFEEKLNKIEIRTTFTAGDPDYELDGDISRNLELRINGKTALKMDEWERIGVNFGHPLIKSTPAIHDFAGTAKLFPKFMTIGEGWVWFKGSRVRVDEKKEFDLDAYRVGWEGVRDNEKKDMLDSFRNGRKADEKISLPTELFPALDEFARYYNYLFMIVRGNLDIQTTIVPASRKIPSEKELVFLISSDDELDNSLEKFYFESRGLPEFAGLARSFAAKLFPEGKHQISTRMGRVPEAMLSKNANCMLRDHLFVERGYRLDMEYRVILDPEQFQDICADHSEKRVPGEFLLLVRLFLVDAQGRKYSFDEVGSGLGYVLPVLCAACDPKIELAMLQQPELHLHPALQAALGDVLIESTRNVKDVGSKTLIVETHSEHLLLRVLRRIRQTQQKIGHPSELSIEADDVAVLYFDPRPDDTTHVTRLRISPEGEFMDRWPRGFFAERDKELFDGDE